MYVPFMSLCQSLSQVEETRFSLDLFSPTTQQTKIYWESRHQSRFKVHLYHYHLDLLENNNVVYVLALLKPKNPFI